MKKWVWKNLVFLILIPFAYNLGYRQRDYYAVKSAKQMAGKLCGAWAEKGGFASDDVDEFGFQMPKRWCNHWDEWGVTKGFQSPDGYIRRWEWFSK